MMNVPFTLHRHDLCHRNRKYMCAQIWLATVTRFAYNLPLKSEAKPQLRATEV